jgi:Fe2+ transport system protein FeoA
MKEFVAMVTLRKGGTEAVTVKAQSTDNAKRKLLEMGYLEVHWVL